MKHARRRVRRLLRPRRRRTTRSSPRTRRASAASRCSRSSHAGRVTGERSISTRRWCSSARCATRCATGRSSDPGSFTRDFMQRAPGGMFGGGRPGGRRPWCARCGHQRRLPRRARPPAVRPLAAPPTGWRHGVTASTSTCSRRCSSLYDVTGSEEVWYEITSRTRRRSSGSTTTRSATCPSATTRTGSRSATRAAIPGHLFEWASLLSRAVELGADPKFVEMGSRSLDLGLKSYNDEVDGLGGRRRPTASPRGCCGGRSAKSSRRPPTTRFCTAATEAVALPPQHARVPEGRVPRHQGRRLVRRLSCRASRAPSVARRPSTRASVDGPEWGAYHQMSMFHDLWRITDPEVQGRARKRGAADATSRGDPTMWTRREMARARPLASAAAMPFVSPAAGRARAPRWRASTACGWRSSRRASASAVRACPTSSRRCRALGLAEIDIMSEHIEHHLGAPGIQLPGAGRPGSLDAPRWCAPGAGPGPRHRPAGGWRGRAGRRRGRAEAGVPGHGPGGARGAARVAPEVDLDEVPRREARCSIDAGQIALRVQPELQRQLHRRRDRARAC